MKILVCVKQVPDTEANPVIMEDSLHIRVDGIAFRMNRYDDYALEEALLIKDEFTDTTIDIISVGPERAIAVLKKGLEKGADNAVFINTGDKQTDAFETASLIAGYVSGKNYDLIFAGVMSEDLMQCQVGPMTASLLSIPCAVSVVKSAIDYDENIITADSELEGGMIETITIPMPCLLTVQTGINQPRYPSLSNVMRARGMMPETVNAETVRDVRLNRIHSLSYPPSDIRGVTIEGTTEGKAGKLIDILHERGLL